MAPSAEAKDGGVCVEDSSSEEQQQQHQQHAQFISPIPKRNVAFAVNYELSMVDQFTASERKRRGSSAFYVDGVPESTGDPTNSWIRSASSPKPFPCAKPDVNPINRGVVVFQTPPLDETSSSSTRRSVREKKKEMVMSRARVRYDMQLVPVVKRNRKFLDSYSVAWTTTSPAVRASSESSFMRTSAFSMARGRDFSATCTRIARP